MESRRLTLRLSRDDVVHLDEIRGGVPRGTYLRHVLREADGSDGEPPVSPAELTMAERERGEAPCKAAVDHERLSGKPPVCRRRIVPLMDDPERAATVARRRARRGAMTAEQDAASAEQFGTGPLEPDRP